MKVFGVFNVFFKRPYLYSPLKVKATTTVKNSAAHVEKLISKVFCFNSSCYCSLKRKIRFKFLPFLSPSKSSNIWDKGFLLLKKYVLTNHVSKNICSHSGLWLYWNVSRWNKMQCPIIYFNLKKKGRWEFYVYRFWIDNRFMPTIRKLTNLW